MPWLSRQGSLEDTANSVTDFRKGAGNRSGSAAMVTFIPAQIDGLCGTSPAHQKQVASRLLWADLRVLMQNITCLPKMVEAAFSMNVLQSCFGTLVDARDIVLQVALAVAQVLMVLFLAPAYLLLPGGIFMACVGMSWLVTAAMTWSLNGARVLMSDRMRTMSNEDYSDECWIYVNGMMCSNASLRSQCNRLSQVFGRPVMGIHNQTSGMVFDFLIFLSQRCLGVQTPCTLALASQLRDACLTYSVRKVILLSHSTGSVHVSLALDQLHSNLPVEVLSKIEIYTFGSAAAHLGNPCLRIDNPKSPINGSPGTTNLNYTRPDGSIASPVKTTPASLGHRVEDHERVMPHIEHYALDFDLLARCGVLHNIRNVLDNRFCGRVFVLTSLPSAKATSHRTHADSGGFLMKEHYLDLLFPATSSHYNHTIEILDEPVDVDVETAEKREFTAQGVALPQKSLYLRSPHQRHSSDFTSRVQRSDSSPEVSPRSGVHGGSKASERAAKRRSWETADALGVSGVRKARLGAKECEGKTVRQLSRLWRYVGGKRPVGEGVAVVNGVGKGGYSHGYPQGHGLAHTKSVSGNGVGLMQ